VKSTHRVSVLAQLPLSKRGISDSCGVTRILAVGLQYKVIGIDHARVTVCRFLYKVRCLVRTKIEKAAEFVFKYLSVKFHEKRFSDSRVATCGQTDGRGCFNRRFAEMRASLKRNLAIRMQLTFVSQISLIKVVRRTEFCVPEHTVSVFRQVICKAV
jgi:hypothetical protein